MPQRLLALFASLAILLMGISWLGTGRAVEAQPVTSVGEPPVLPRSALMFIENVGQFAGEARFQVRGSDHAVWLAEDAIWVTLWEPAGPTALTDHEAAPFTALTTTDTPRRGVNLRLSFVGANPASEMQATEVLSTTISYFLGNDPAGWRPAVPVWGGVRYRELYPGLDLELVGQGSTLAPRLVCHVADCATALAAVQLEVVGAEEVTMAEEAVLIHTAVGDWHLPLLAVVDEVGRPVAVSMAEAVVMGERVERPFASPPALGSLPTLNGTTNPAGDSLLYSTFLGGLSQEENWAVALDEAGNTFITGWTFSSGFPTTPGAFDTMDNGFRDVFVTKLSATGDSLLYSTFLGSEGGEEAYAIAVDAAGNAAITGYTGASDFPTTPGAFDTTYNGGTRDAFAVKFSADGSSLLYSTFLGGIMQEDGSGIAIDEAGNAFITGSTTSSNFPTTPGAFDTDFTNYEVFVTKLNATGDDLLYSTFLGGGSYNFGNDIALDAAGNAHVTGTTGSPNFPTTPGAFDTTFNGKFGTFDAFVTKFNADGSGLLYSTFLGSISSDHGSSIVLDGEGNAFVTGGTRSPNFPITPGAFDTTFNGGTFDTFVTKFNADGSDLLYSTFFGGVNLDDGHDITIDEAGNAVITGDTASANFPTTPGAFDTIFNGEEGLFDAYVTRLNADGSGLLYSTFLGGGGDEVGNGIAQDGTGKILITGHTDSAEFPITPDAFDTTYNNNRDVFVAQLSSDLPVVAGFTADPTSGLAPLEVNFTNLSSGGYVSTLWEFGDGITSTLTHPVHEYLSPGVYTVTLRISGPGGKDMLAIPAFITVDEPVTADFAADPISGPAPLTVSLSNLSSGNFDSCLWEFGDGSTSEACDNPTHTYTTAGMYTVMLTISGPAGEDTLTAPDLIVVYEPVTAGFTATPTSGNAPLLVAFTNLSTGDYDSCLWEFGDGSTSTNCNNPGHTYTLPGTYNVTLTVSGPGGSDNDTRPGYITVESYPSQWLFLPLVSGQD